MNKIKILILIIIAIILTNCTLHLGTFSSPEEIMDWIYNNIEYKLNTYYNANPIETLNNRYGDCNDMTWLFGQMCHEHLNIIPFSVLLKEKNVKNTGHVISSIQNKYYDIQRNNILTNKKIIKKFYIIKAINYQFTSTLNLTCFD